jgi:hypothetical protein
MSRHPLRPTYQISIGGEPAARVRKHFFTRSSTGSPIDIPGPDDLEMSGEQTVATVSKQWPGCSSIPAANR